MYIDEYIRRYSSIKRIIDLGTLSSVVEPTEKIIKNQDKIVVFNVETSPIKCYANMLSQRRDIYRLFNTKNDIETYKKMLEALNNPSKPVFEDFKKYYRSEKLSLYDIPFIKYYEEDAGHYLTSSIVASCYRDICNASFHRVLRINRNKATLRIVPRHLDYIVKRHHSKGRDAPVAIILGLHPLYEIAAASSPPLGVYEFYVANTMLGDPRMVKTPLYNIPIPPYAGIVIEGRITREYVWEGPFVDILRITDKRRKQPVFVVDKIYVSRDHEPMVHAIVSGYSEHLNLMGFPREPLIYDSVREVVPTVKSVRLTPGGGGWLHVVVSIRKERAGEARNAGLAVLNAHPSVKHVVVVDDDIDVDDPYMIEWAIATRVKAGEDIYILRGLRGSTLDPRGVNGVGDKMIIDATKPFNEDWDKYRMVKPR